MLISGVELPTADADSAADFFGRTLDLPVDRKGSRVVVRIGRSSLVLDPGPPGAGAHHLAFTVSSDRFADAARWLRTRVPLLALRGVDEFGNPEPPWNSRSVYFTGPDGLILELIARQALPPSSADETDTDLLCISEVGIAVADVGAAVATLRHALAVDTFGEPSPTFAPVGDQDGLLIVVHQDRVWFPTTQTRASTGSLTVTLAVDGPARSIALSAGCTVRTR